MERSFLLLFPFSLYKAYRLEGNLPILIKLSDSNSRETREKQIYHEYCLIRELNKEHTIHCLGYEKYSGGLALILEDFISEGGKTLADWCQSRKLTIHSFLETACQLAKGLEAIHSQRIIHKKIHPENIIVMDKDHSFKYFNFSSASRLSLEEREVPDTHGSVQQTNSPKYLFYTAPEQTGRVSTTEGIYTDLYSLGICFYEFLFGKPPFISEDPMEIIHAHIAKEPQWPSHTTGKESVPEAIQKINAKLLAKNVEERYQSASGLREDLQRCLNELEEKGRIDPFELGSEDILNIFRIPVNFYGRSKELKELEASFAEVQQGKSRLHLIGGKEGIGKSTLVERFGHQLSASGAFFMSGKFDEGVPYSAIIQAFQGFIRNILKQDQKTLLLWKKKLVHNINPNLGLLIELIPEIEFIVGEQNIPPNLPFQESKRRFQYVFKKFISTFVSPQSPLVIFLDDLHLAGPESLELLKSFFEGRPAPFFLLIAAYRNSQEDIKTHLEEFRQYSLKTLPESFAKKEELFLQPMDLKSTYKLVRDSLLTKEKIIQEEDIDTWVTKVSMMSTVRSKQIQEKKTDKATGGTKQNRNLSLIRGEDVTGPHGHDLAFVLFAKTDGNFMLAKEMLKQLYQEEIISFDNSEKQWVWEITKVRTFALSDDTLELLIQNLQKIEEEELKVLQSASVIGTSFNILILSDTCQKDASEVFPRLQELIQNGLILPLSKQDSDSLAQSKKQEISKPDYRFAHSTIQQTALRLLSETEAEKLHALAGKAYIARLNRKEIYNHLIDIVNHLNKGYTFLRDEEKISLIQQNLEAGCKAKKSLAYDTALNFFYKGIFFFDEVGREKDRELVVSLNQQLGEICYLRNEWSKAKQHFSAVLEKAKKIPEKLKAYEAQISIQTGENHFHEAVKIGFTALKSINMRLPEMNSDKIRVQQLQKLESSIVPKELMNAPDGKDPLQDAKMRILMQISAPARMISSALFMLLTAEMLSISSKYGKNEITPYACISCGSILFAKTNNLLKASQFGDLALKLLTQIKKSAYSFSIYYMYASNTLPQKHHIRDTIPYFRKAFSESLTNGAFEYASMSVVMIHFTGILSGTLSYEEIEREMTESRSFLDYYGHKYSQELFYMLWQYIRLMRGEGKYSSLLAGPKFDERKSIPLWKEKENHEGLFYLYCIKSILACLFYDYETSHKYAEQAWQYSETILAFLPITTLKFFHCFSLIQLGRSSKKQKPIKSRQSQHTASSLMADIKNLSVHNPKSFSHLYILLQAQEAVAEERNENAMNLCDQAIKAAQKNGFVFYEAFANEIAIEFYLNLKKIKFASLYYEEAKRLYKLHHISAKINNLELRFHKRFTEELQNKASKENKISSNSENALDMITVMKASQAISQEIRLSHLLRKMVEILMESAGAQKVFLLLQEDGEWKIQAEGSLDKEEPFSVMQNIKFEESNELDHAVVQYVIRTKETLAFANVSEDKVFGNSSYVIKEKTRSLLCMPILLQGNFSGVLYLENRNMFGAFTEERIKMLTILSSQISASLKNAHLYSNLENALKREKTAREAQEKITKASHKFVPMEFLRELGQTEIVDLTLGTHVKKEMAILFSDIRSFTNLSEEMTPEDNFNFINSYLEKMGPIVRSCGGFIDKYIGDAIMALFSRPEKSIQSAILMLETLIPYNERRIRLKRRTIQIGIGIHTGSLMLGTVGEQERMQGTVISDSVNLAARLEGLTKMYGASIVTSQYTFDKMDSSEEFLYRVLDTVQVKGKKLPTQVIEILDGLPPEEKELKIKFLDDFQEGSKLYSRKKFENARKIFQGNTQKIKRQSRHSLFGTLRNSSQRGHPRRLATSNYAHEQVKR